jgi:hypothetical protein
MPWVCMSSLLGVFYGLSRETEQISKKNLHASQLRCSNGLTLVEMGAETTRDTSQTLDGRSLCAMQASLIRRFLASLPRAKRAIRPRLIRSVIGCQSL